MSKLDKPTKRMNKELTLLSVYAIATGTTLSAGFFLLPGLAASKAGPAITLAYLIAAIPMLPAMLCVVELATAMPRAGGAYYFLDRSFGPVMGTIGGFGTWTALVLKTAFALVGMGAYIALYFPNLHTIPIAIGLALIFGFLNILGAKKSGGMQIILVIGLLIILTWFLAQGVTRIEKVNLDNFFSSGLDSLLATAGLVYISYVGITNVASVAEEVKNPERNLPLGVFLSFGTAVLVYGLGTYVMIGVLGAEQLAGVDTPNLTPVATVAEVLLGKWGVALVSAAALLAFSSVANAGILSSSRYPLAMARDHLLPAYLRKLSKRNTPTLSICISVSVIILILFLDIEKIVKLASATQLLIFALLCCAVIVMRESKIDSYDPGYRVPLYPWLPLIGIISPFWLIAEMGFLPIIFTSALVAAGGGWYYYYARNRVERHGAIYHIFERLGRRRYDALDHELRTILKEKGLREEDPFDEIVALAGVIEAKSGATFNDIVIQASAQLAVSLQCDPQSLANNFMEGTRVGATPVTGNVALPHTRLPNIKTPYMVMVRARPGIIITTNEAMGNEKISEPINAIFFLVSPEDDPSQHLRLLARLAQIVDSDHFQTRWKQAENDQELKELLIHHDNHLFLIVDRSASTSILIDKAIKDIDIPEGCLIVLVHRGRQVIVPQGSTVLAEGDRITVIGRAAGIQTLRQQFTV